MRGLTSAVLVLALGLYNQDQADACQCSGKDVPCHEGCVQICSPDGASAEVCGRKAGDLLMAIGKETPSRKQLEEAARLFSHPAPSAVYLRDASEGKVMRVPIDLLRPFAGITLSVRGASTTEFLHILAAGSGVKLEVAGRIEGPVSMVVHEAQLREIMDDFCEAKRCAWSLNYSDDGWILRVAGEAGAPSSGQ